MDIPEKKPRRRRLTCLIVLAILAGTPFLLLFGWGSPDHPLTEQQIRRLQSGENQGTTSGGPGPDSWKPGDAIPEKYRHERNERGRSATGGMNTHPFPFHPLTFLRRMKTQQFLHADFTA